MTHQHSSCNTAMLTTDRGAVLITVLLLVALMSALAVSLLDIGRFAGHQQIAIERYEQAKSFALGGEAIAIEALHTDLEAKSRVHHQQAWAQKRPAFPINNGPLTGAISVSIQSANECFNVNSLVTRRNGGRYSAHSDHKKDFEALLSHIGLPPSTKAEITGQLIDWIDTDSRVSPLGAEDYEYGKLSPPKRAANTLIAHIDELIELPSISQEILGILKPYLCALPSTDRSRVNINLLAPEQEALLRMITGKALNQGQATGILTSRAADGYNRLADFWSHPALKDKAFSSYQKSYLSLNSEYFIITSDVLYDQLTLRLTSMVRRENDGRIYLLFRQFGEIL